MDAQDDEFILVASVGKPVGLKGWAKVNSFTRPPENLFNFKNFYLDKKGKKEILKIDQFSKSGKNYILKVESLNSIEEIEILKNKEIFIKAEDLPKLDEDKFYWKDLIGSEVINQSNESLGEVIKIENHGASDLLFVKGVTEQVIPVTDEFFKSFDLQNKIIIVEWEEI